MSKAPHPFVFWPNDVLLKTIASYRRIPRGELMAAGRARFGALLEEARRRGLRP